MPKINEKARKALIEYIQTWINDATGGQLCDNYWTGNSAEIMAEAALTHVRTSMSFEKEAKIEGWLE